MNADSYWWTLVSPGHKAIPRGQNKAILFGFLWLTLDNCDRFEGLCHWYCKNHLNNLDQLLSFWSATKFWVVLLWLCPFDWIVKVKVKRYRIMTNAKRYLLPNYPITCRSWETEIYRKRISVTAWLNHEIQIASRNEEKQIQKSSEHQIYICRAREH